MPELSEHIQRADWKKEKHVPVMDCPDSVKAGEVFQVMVTLGKEVAHPNTMEHHIRRISLYYHEEGANSPTKSLMSSSARMENRPTAPIRVLSTPTTRSTGIAQSLRPR